MSNKSIATIATMGIDIGKHSFHVVGLDRRGAIVLQQKWSWTIHWGQSRQISGSDAMSARAQTAAAPPRCCELAFWATAERAFINAGQRRCEARQFCSDG